MADFAKDLRKILMAAGCTVVRSGGKHPEIWWSPITNKKFSVQHRIKSRPRQAQADSLLHYLRFPDGLRRGVAGA